MSGGYFDYIQYRISDTSELLDKVISENTKGTECGYARGYSRETIREFQLTKHYLEMAALYLNRVDYLLECDDSEETFHKHLYEELNDRRSDT